MPKKCQILGGRRIPGTAEYAFVGLRAACSVSTPENSERSWRIAKAVGLRPPIGGKRVWYRIPGDGLSDSYISIWPGEYRTIEPTDASDLILELPEVDADDTLTVRLAELLKFLRDQCIEEHDAEVIASLLERFESPDVAKEREASIFVSVHESIRTGNSQLKDHVDDLLERGLFEHGESLVTFAASLALLNIQNMMNQWVAPTRKSPFGKEVLRAYENPISIFRADVRDRASSKDRSHLESALKEIGDVNYLEARTAIQEGLGNISLVTFTRSLIAVANYYFIARLVAQVVEENALSVPLVYGIVQADEGFACTKVGLNQPAAFLFSDAIDIPQELVQLLESGKTEAEISFKFTSAVWPRFTKKFFRVLMATARILRLGQSSDQGLKELQTLQHDYDDAIGKANVEFERGWIDWALMNAYMIRGDESEARKYAQKMALYTALRGSGAKSQF